MSRFPSSLHSPAPCHVLYLRRAAHLVLLRPSWCTSRVRVYLQDDRRSQLVYWIERSGGAIVGWFAAPRMFNQLIGAPFESLIDFHFTYPADGNLHVSLKDQTSPNGDEIFETIFSDRVRRRTIVGGVPSIWEEPRDDSISDWRDCLVPLSRPPPLSDYAQKPIRFPFATAAIPIANGRVGAVLDRLPPSEGMSSQCRPIAVGPLGTGVINLSAYLVGAGAALTWSGDELIWTDCDNSHLPHIELCASFYSTPTS
jgi:hypothetical protein